MDVENERCRAIYIAMGHTTPFGNMDMCVCFMHIDFMHMCFCQCIRLSLSQLISFSFAFLLHSRRARVCVCVWLMFWILGCHLATCDYVCLAMNELILWKPPPTTTMMISTKSLCVHYNFFSLYLFFIHSFFVAVAVSFVRLSIHGLI